MPDIGFRRAGAQGFPPGTLRRPLPEAACSCRLRPAGADPGRARRDARRRGIPHHRPHAGRPAGRIQRARPPHRDPDRLRHRVRRRDGLWQGGAQIRALAPPPSVRPAVCASGRAALPAPSRRSRARSASMKWSRACRRSIFSRLVRAGCPKRDRVRLRNGTASAGRRRVAEGRRTRQYRVRKRAADHEPGFGSRCTIR